MRRYTIEVDGRRFEVDVEEAGERRYGVRVGAQTFDVTLAGDEELAKIVPQVGPSIGAPAAARVAPATRAGAAPAGGRTAAPALARSAGALDIVGAPMPGVILRLAVAAGAHVRRGQDLAVLEAMKMENIVRAPRDGVVAEVCVEAGQQVGHGAPIVRLAPAAAP